MKVFRCCAMPGMQSSSLHDGIMGKLLSLTKLKARCTSSASFVTLCGVPGCEACIWSTSDGADLGKIASGNQFLCCDITSFAFGGSQKLVATLETDGGIRVFTNVLSEWHLAQAVQTLSLVVEVKLERHLLVAVSHSAGAGSVHLWHLGFDTNSSDPDVNVLLQEYCMCDFSQPPDRVEARHGGRFIEVQFLTEGLSVDGIYDVEWLEPSRLHCLLALKSCIGDWRCDLRDVVGVLGNDSEGTVLHWLLLWQPLHSSQAKMHSSWQNTTCLIWFFGLSPGDELGKASNIFQFANAETIVQAIVLQYLPFLHGLGS